MLMKKFFSLLLICVTATCYADLPSGIQQTLQINTFFKAIVGKPTWLLEIRDIESGRVSPYIFDIRNNENYWVAFSSERTYRIVASKLKFGPYAVITNFCGLEDGILDGQSMFITLTGYLTPNANTSRCRVTKYKDSGSTFINSNSN